MKPVLNGKKSAIVVAHGLEQAELEVVVDNGLVTNRKPAHVPSFDRKMLEQFAESRLGVTTSARSA